MQLQKRMLWCIWWNTRTGTSAPACTSCPGARDLQNNGHSLWVPAPGPSASCQEGWCRWGWARWWCQCRCTHEWRCSSVDHIKGKPPLNAGVKQGLICEYVWIFFFSEITPRIIQVKKKKFNIIKNPPFVVFLLLRITGHRHWNCENFKFSGFYLGETE